MTTFSADEIFGWVEDQTRFGVRRPGSPAGLAQEAWLESQLRAFGLESVRREPIPIVRWEATACRCSVGSAGSLAPVDAFPIPYVVFPGPDGVEGPLVHVDSRQLWLDPALDLRGAVVVTEIRFPDLPVALLRRLSMGAHDPDDTLSQITHPATWVRLGWHVYHAAARRGAAAFLGVLRDQPGGSGRMYAPYGFKEKDILDKPLPGCWLGREAGRQVLDLARSSRGRARVEITGRREPALTHNVVAEIPGRTDEVTVLSCHHDSPFVSPVEDGTGVAVVLALARHLAARHRAGQGLERRLVVLLTAGHFYGSIGTRTFIREHPDLVRQTALEISIEHVAREAAEDASGHLVPTGRPEASGVFVPFSNAVSEAVLSAARRHGLDRTLLLPAEGPLGPYPPTDGGDWWAAGVPVVNHISNPVYLLTDDDALDWVDRPRLARVAATFADVIAELDRLPRARLAANDRPVYAALMRVLRLANLARTTRFGLHPVY
jgi:hypothetical protein